MTRSDKPRRIFEDMPFNEWLDFPNISPSRFSDFFDIIDQPRLRPGININLDLDMNKFMKTKYNPF